MSKEFPKTFEDGRLSYWFKNSLAMGLLAIIFLHSLFAYTEFNQGYYPIKDQENSVIANLLVWLIWSCSTPSLFIFMSRANQELLSSKGLGYFFKKKVLGYLKTLAVIYPINLFLWFVIYHSFIDKMTLNDTGLPFWPFWTSVK